jgi:hypothetical protein
MLGSQSAHRTCSVHPEADRESSGLGPTKVLEGWGQGPQGPSSSPETYSRLSPQDASGSDYYPPVETQPAKRWVQPRARMAGFS